ncbi:MAG: ABC transporter ATP-binding protein [Pseudomonadota bacterium]
MLRIESLHSGYTAIDVLRGVSLSVPDRSIVGLLGPNGAGKTALMRALSGLNAVRSGSIQLDGVELAGAGPDRIVELGVVQVPQGRMLFGSMTVSDNLAMGAFLQRDRRAIARQLDLVHSMFPILHARASQPAAYLSGGEQQMLALGRALMAQPRLLLLDEPSLGLAPKVFDTILEQVQLIHAAGASVLIAEQNARKVLRIADYCYLIEGGVIALEGPASQLARDPRIEQVYLGGHSHPLSI